jgi:ferric-dicitrate binding protein FerR (iron transport regulator)
MDGCNRIHELWDRETAGEILGAGDAAFAAEHLGRCPDCRLEADAVAAMDVDGPGGPPPWADELARRRLIDAVVEGADRRRSDGARARRSLALAGIGAAAAAAVLAAVMVSGSGESHPATGGDIEVARAPAALEGRVLLVSADAEAGSASLDRPIVAGNPLPTAAGLTVVGLGPGIRVALQPGAAARVTRLDREAVALEVRGGTLIAWVDPDLEQPRFTVETPGGAITVDGTVFRLEVAGDRAEVGVLRGKVALLEPGREPRQVGIGEAAVLGGEGRAVLAPAAEAAVLDVMTLLNVLATERDARVEIRSLPAGAEVTLDDVVLGATPLFAAIRPGHRAIALDLPGHAAVREILEISRGEFVSRVFDLQAGDPIPALENDPATGVARPVPGPTAAELLEAAQALRSSRDWAGAAAAYDAILRRHGASTEARSAAISSATIKLDHLGDTAGALRLFDGYLARHGTGALAQEAAWGRCRSLRGLGRAAEERAALRAFLAGHPSALEADQARARLAEIEK